MIKCSKCGSSMPDSYNYCIYCSQKLAKTPENREAKEKFQVTPVETGIIVGAVLLLALIIVCAFIF